MKKIAVILSLGVILAGCEHKLAPRSEVSNSPTPKEMVDRFNASQAAEVPVPKSTPFDADPRRREAYLYYFEAGYRAWLGGTWRSGVLLGEYPDAARKGYEDGIAAARIAFPKNA